MNRRKGHKKERQEKKRRVETGKFNIPDLNVETLARFSFPSLSMLTSNTFMPKQTREIDINPFTAKCGQGQNSTKIPKFRFVKFWKQIAPFESTGREVSFEWSQHRLLSTDSKVRTRRPCWESIQQ